MPKSLPSSQQARCKAALCSEIRREFTGRLLELEIGHRALAPAGSAALFGQLNSSSCSLFS